MAQTTSINPNTIQKAYRDLETDGFIYTVTGRGNFVSPTTDRVNPKRLEELMTIIKTSVSELIYLGMSENEILKVFKDIVPKEGGKP